MAQFQYTFSDAAEKKAVIDWACWAASQVEADYRQALRRRNTSLAFREAATAIYQRDQVLAKKAVAILDSIALLEGREP